MAWLTDFKFFDSGSTATESNVLYLSPSAEELVLQASGSSVDVTVEGKADTENGGWIALSALNHTGFAVSDGIAEAGIFSVPVSGLKAVRAINNGNAGDVTLYAVVASGG